jgi:hypothetical protein
VRGTAATCRRGLAAFACAALIVPTAMLAGCGAGSTPSRSGTTASTTAASAAAGSTAPAAPARAGGHGASATHGRVPAPGVPNAHNRALVAKVDVTSDRVLREGKVHIAKGAPSDAEVRRELEAARKHGAKLPAGESVAAFEAAAAQSAEPAPDAVTPLAPWNPRSKPIAAWIVPVLEWAFEHGWHGTVTSGYRTYFEQAQLNAAGLFSAPAGYSNHESTVYPGGAVDVTDPARLLAVLNGYAAPRRLVGGVLGPADPEHFSATGL